MEDCCETKGQELAALRGRQGRVLGIVLAVNAAMFCIEFVAGLIVGSTALLGDSLDMLGDTFVYAFSLYVLHRGTVWRARAALSKGLVMLGLGCAVLVQAAVQMFAGVVPEAHSMAGVGALAFAANAACFALLWRHRGDDINLRSTWLCSRNDLIANAAVLAAALLVAATHSLWPDLLVGLGIALLFLRTSVGVLREALDELRGSAPPGGESGAGGAPRESNPPGTASAAPRTVLKTAPGTSSGRGSAPRLPG